MISVIVPVYNVEPYLDDCLESVLSQTHADLEVILINDASQDSSGSKCDDWSKSDSRVRVIHHSANLGLSAARNTGIEAANGSYLTFVDSDDVVSPVLLSTMLGQALSANAALVVSGWVGFTDRIPFFVEAGVRRVGTGAEMLREIVVVASRWSACAKLYARWLFDVGLRFPDGLLYEDLYLAPRVLALTSTVVLTDDALYGYRQDRLGSIMKDHSMREVSVDLIAVLTSNIEFAREHCSSAVHFNEMLAAYVLHGSKQLELPQMGRGLGWKRNRLYRSAYKVMARRYAGEMLRCHHWALHYRLVWATSVFAPIVFRELVGVRSWLQSAPRRFVLASAIEVP